MVIVVVVSIFGRRMIMVAKVSINIIIEWDLLFDLVLVDALLSLTSGCLICICDLTVFRLGFGCLGLSFKLSLIATVGVHGFSFYQ